jgi:beta-phosphoglucomutase-like phosphatase (HAD superfamily)
MPLKALIFDVDGTLAENEEWHRRAFNESFKAFGLDWNWDTDLYRQLLKVTGGKERIRHFIETASPPHGAEVLAKLSAFHADKTARYADYVVSGAITAKPGIKRLVLEANRSGVLLGIATTTALSNVEALIKSIFGVDAGHLFAVIAAGDIVPRKKPAPDIYLYACERLGVSPSACVAIEDSANGVQAAHDAGIAVVAAPSFYLSGDDFSKATSVVSDLGEPDAPNRFIAGQRIGTGFVDLASLRDLAASRVKEAH